MCDVDFSFFDVDDLAMMASDLLDQFRDRGMPDTIQRKVLNNTYDANNLEKLRELVAKFKAAIEAHDAKVAAAQAALSAHESLAIAHVDGMHASFSESPFSTAILFFRCYKRQPQRNRRQHKRECTRIATRGGARGESLHDKIKPAPQ
jgi:hypothetical protein